MALVAFDPTKAYTVFGPFAIRIFDPPTMHDICNVEKVMNRHAQKQGFFYRQKKPPFLLMQSPRPSQGFNAHGCCRWSHVRPIYPL